MNYCTHCGTKLISKVCNTEGYIPYCPTCEEFRFPTFNTAISTAILNPAKDKILLIQQYGKKQNILLAGYVNKGEDAEDALIRETKEEVGLTITSYQFMKSKYYEPSNTLMLNFLSVANTEDLSGMTNEVDMANWFSFKEAREKIKKNSLAEFFLKNILDQLEKGTVTI